MREFIRKKHAPERTDFERAHLERCRIGGEDTDIIDARPGGEKCPQPVLVAPGWGATIHGNSPMLELLTKQGRRVISLNHPRQGDDISDSALALSYSLPRAETRKASNLLELLDARGVSADLKADVIAFSEGALNTLIAAYTHPERFRTIVLFAPAGLIGRDSLWNLMHRFRAQAKKDASVGVPSLRGVEPSEAQRTMMEHMAKTWETEGSTYVKENIPRALAEMRALASMRVDDMVRFVRAAGVKVVVVTAVDDLIFPAKKMAERMPKDSLDGFLAVRGAHGPQYAVEFADYIFDRFASTERTSGTHV